MNCGIFFVTSNYCICVVMSSPCVDIFVGFDFVGISWNAFVCSSVMASSMA
jgi:hypothetical protein